MGKKGKAGPPKGPPIPVPWGSRIAADEDPTAPPRFELNKGTKCGWTTPEEPLRPDHEWEPAAPGGWRKVQAAWNAAWHGDVATITKLAGAGGALGEAHPDDGTTPFFICCAAYGAGGASKNSVEIATKLQEEGVDINAANKVGVTPLSVACSRENLDLVKFLLGTGKVKVDKADDNKETALFAASNNGKVRAARLLVQAEADVDLANSEGRSALHAAAARGHAPIVRLLCDSGASVDTADSAGDTPLLLAAAQGRRRAVLLLLEHGAALSSTNGAGLTPLAAALKHKHFEVATVLETAQRSQESLTALAAEL